VSPRSIVSVGWAPLIGSGWRRMAMTVIPALTRNPASASVLPIHGLSSGTAIQKCSRSRPKLEPGAPVDDSAVASWWGLD